MEQGWIKLHRNLLENKALWQNKDKLAIWLFLLLKATHTEAIGYFAGENITLKSGQLLVSYQEIADFLNIDKGKVKRAIQSFRDDTLIDTRTDRQKSLISLVNWDILQSNTDTRIDTEYDTQVTHQRHTIQETENEKEKRSKREKVKEKEINKNDKNVINNNPLYPPRDEEAHIHSIKDNLFDLFWQSYPKKIGKGYAKKCFDKIKPSKELVDTMIEAINVQKKSEMWQRDKGQYIPNPSTWLNQQRWLDDLNIEIERDNPWKGFDLGITL